VSHDVKQKKRMDMRVWVSDEEALFVLAEALGVQCSPPREDLRWTSPHGDEPWAHCTWQGGVADLLQWTRSARGGLHPGPRPTHFS